VKIGLTGIKMLSLKKGVDSDTQDSLGAEPMEFFKRAM